jgi:hypothetical protein
MPSPLKLVAAWAKPASGLKTRSAVRQTAIAAFLFVFM